MVRLLNIFWCAWLAASTCVVILQWSWKTLLIAVFADVVMLWVLMFVIAWWCDKKKIPFITGEPKQ